MPCRDSWHRQREERCTAGHSHSQGLILRIGFGYDSHAFGADRPLILGGVEADPSRGLRGHSDADALCHAITDALLGGAAMGDIGQLFPDTDPAYRNANSIGLLAEAARRVTAAGYTIVNVDATIIAEFPRIAPLVPRMRANLAAALGIDPDRVSVKGKTNEGMDATGRGEGIVVHAVASLAGE